MVTSSTATRFLLVAALVVSAAMLALSWNMPLLEYGNFRQTQTAISSYWMATSTNWLAYPTPILGYPWSFPLEFPLFQAIVLGVANLLPITLDQSGRLVSWLFAVLTVFPLWFCVRQITGRSSLAKLVVLFFLVSPLYLFGARQFMIESTALFFGVLFVAVLVRYWSRPSAALFVLMAVAATLAALVKITTFFGFGMAGLFFVAWRFASEKGIPDAGNLARRYLPVAAAVAIAILATAWYVRMGDQYKAQSVGGASMTSSGMSNWIYGTWQQRTGAGLWRDVVLGRAARQLLGSVFVLPACLLALALFGRGLRGFAACLSACYLLPFLVFANLHQVHDYYQQANGIFLLGLLACSVEGLRTRFGEVVAVAATLVLLVVMLLGFQRDFLHYITSPRFSQRTISLATFARRQTSPDDVLVIFGFEASSEVPYYATRRAMMVQDNVSSLTLRRMRERPASYSGPFRVGLVIVCPNELAAQARVATEYKLLLDSLVSGRERFRVAGCDVYK